MARQTEYTDEQKAYGLAVLRTNNGNAKRTAQQIGVPLSTLRAWAGRRESEGKHAADVEPQAIDEIGKVLSKQWGERADSNLKLMGRLQQKMDEALERGDTKEAKVLAGAIRDLAVSAGVATEKESFARGGPTARTETTRVSLMPAEELSSQALRVIEGGKKAVQGGA